MNVFEDLKRKCRRNATVAIFATCNFCKILFRLHEEKYHSASHALRLISPFDLMPCAVI